MQQAPPPRSLHHDFRPTGSCHDVLIHAAMLKCRGLRGYRERNISLEKNRLDEEAQQPGVILIVGFTILLAIAIDEHAADPAAVLMLFDRR